MSQCRLDSALAERGIVASRQRAKDMILAGHVAVNGKIVLKPSYAVSEEDELSVAGGELKYASRAGLKLERAVQLFGIDIKDKVCADIGASTGGFTDLMLQSGAKKVYAVDVGHGQLVRRLAQDSRVVNMEGVSVKQLNRKMFSERIDIMTADLSFISLRTSLPYMLSVLEADAELVCLVKPQFEAGKSAVGKGGIVRDKKAHIAALNGVCELAAQLGCKLVGATYSPVKGGDGNIEYLIYGVFNGKPSASGIDTDNIVREAFDALNKK